MHCKHCGEKIEKDSKFCSFCGGKITHTEKIIEPEKTENETSKIIPEDKKNGNLNSFLIWVGFNTFALIMSYSHIMPFSNYSGNRTDKFWPFVEFYTTDKSYIMGIWYKETYFHGIFVNYDWSEYLIYVGLVGLFLIINKQSNKKNI